MDPQIAYLHKRNADVEIILWLTKTFEAYVSGKITIHKGNMSEVY